MLQSVASAMPMLPDHIVGDRALLDGMHQIRILVAEDVKMNQVIATTLLRGAGLDVVVVDNGAEAVEAVQSGNFDLVLMDIEMPVMGGLDATRKIREMPRAIRWIPIIALSGNASPDTVERCRRAGMNDHMEKPMNLKTMLEMVARWSGGAPRWRTDHSTVPDPVELAGNTVPGRQVIPPASIRP